MAQSVPAGAHDSAYHTPIPPFGPEINPSSPSPRVDSNAPKVFVLLAREEGPATGEAVRERSNSAQSNARHDKLLDGRWICEGAREEKIAQGMGTTGLDERPSPIPMGALSFGGRFRQMEKSFR